MERVKGWIKWAVRRHWWLPVTSVVVASLILSRLNQPELPLGAPRVLVATRDLPRDQPFSLSDFGFEVMPSGDSSRYVTDQILHQLTHSSYANAIGRGERLTFQNLQWKQVGLRGGIPKGYRAYVIKPDNPWLASGGDRIDILLRPREERLSPILIAQDIEVLERLGRGEKSELVVAVRSRELELLEKARQQGKLSIALIGEKEPSSSDRPFKGWQGKRARSKSIPIITEAD